MSCTTSNTHGNWSLFKTTFPVISAVKWLIRIYFKAKDNLNLWRNLKCWKSLMKLLKSQKQLYDKVQEKEVIYTLN